MLVDYERAWLQLKAAIAAKPHHGQRDLLADMARLEVENVLDGDVPTLNGGHRTGADAPGRRAARRDASDHDRPADAGEEDARWRQARSARAPMAPTAAG